MKALPSEELDQVNLDIPSAVTAILGALPAITSLRERAVKLPFFDVWYLDNLGTCAMAMDRANTIHVMVTKPQEPIPELAARCEKLLEVLTSDIQTLDKRGIIDGSSLSSLRGGTSFRNIAFDLFAVAYLLRVNWNKIQGRSALQLSELAEAEQLADRLVTSLGLKQQAPSAAAPTGEMRRRAFTLFMITYNEVYRAVHFLETKRIEDFLPGVHVPRGPAKKKPEVVEPEAPAQTGVHAAIPASSLAHEDAPSAAVGMPGSSPYKV